MYLSVFVSYKKSNGLKDFKIVYNSKGIRLNMAYNNNITEKITQIDPLCP